MGGTAAYATGPKTPEGPLKPPLYQVEKLPAHSEITGTMRVGILCLQKQQDVSEKKGPHRSRTEGPARSGEKFTACALVGDCRYLNHLNQTTRYLNCPNCRCLNYRFPNFQKYRTDRSWRNACDDVCVCAMSFQCRCCCSRLRCPIVHWSHPVVSPRCPMILKSRHRYRKTIPVRSACCCPWCPQSRPRCRSNRKSCCRSGCRS